MAKRNNEHISMADALREFIESNRLQGGIDQVSVSEAWGKLMGPAIQKYTEQTRLDGHTLYVRLNSSVLREELGYGKQKIIRLLNESLGKELIEELVLR